MIDETPDIVFQLSDRLLHGKAGRKGVALRIVRVGDS